MFEFNPDLVEEDDLDVEEAELVVRREEKGEEEDEVLYQLQHIQ